MQINFTSHNIRLDNGTVTIPTKPDTWNNFPVFTATKRLLKLLFPGDKRGLRLADLGCLEGGYSVEFARMGFSVVGVEIRDSNLACCNYVKENTNLPNLHFVKDNVWNIANYGEFDVMFCTGLFYHIDRPKEFLRLLSSVTSKVLIINTHFSTDNASRVYPLSDMQENEGIKGRWYSEFANDEEFDNRENIKWNSWDNKSSFWVKREYLLQEIKNAGFDLVFEQFDQLSPDIVTAMTTSDGYYKKFDRGTFIGIRS